MRKLFNIKIYFGLIFLLQRKQYCPYEKIPSRIESECMTGEGIQFIFPKKSCDFITNNKSSMFNLLTKKKILIYSIYNIFLKISILQ